MYVDRLDKEKQLGLKKVLSMKTVKKKTEKREERGNPVFHYMAPQCCKRFSLRIGVGLRLLLPHHSQNFYIVCLRKYLERAMLVVATKPTKNAIMENHSALQSADVVWQPDRGRNAPRAKVFELPLPSHHVQKRHRKNSESNLLQLHLHKRVWDFSPPFS